MIKYGSLTADLECEDPNYMIHVNCSSCESEDDSVSIITSRLVLIIIWEIICSKNYFCCCNAPINVCPTTPHTRLGRAW